MKTDTALIDAGLVHRFVDQNGGILGITLEKLESFRKQHKDSLDASGREALSNYINIELSWGDGD